MNLDVAKNKVLNLLDETETSTSALNDYIPKMNGYFDSAQKEVALIKPIRKTFSITQNNPENLLGTSTSLFSLQEHINEDVIYECVGATSYHFFVDDIATIYIEEYLIDTWTVIQTIDHVSNTYKTYKGLFSITNATNKVRIRFSGSYYYHFHNVAMWAIPFSSAEKIPNFSNFAYHTVPNDFYKAEKVTKDGVATKDYHWENPHLLRLDYYDYGEFLLHYQAYPTTIDENTLDSYEFEVDIEAQEALPYYVAAYCVVTEDQQYYVNFLSEYRGRLSNLDAKGTFGNANTNNGNAGIKNTFFRGGKRGI